MFFNCKSLVEFVEFAYFDINKREIKDKQDEKEKYFNSEDINKNDNFYPDSIDESIINGDISTSSKENINYFLSEFIKIYRTKENCLVYLQNMRNMFYFCSSLTSLPDTSKWNTKNVNDMSYMFNGCLSLISLPDLSKWKTDNVNLINSMFNGCLSLISLPDISK